ncbi:MAG: ribosome-associated translation inhibitor RaiA [Microbacteriaceae bacterium]|nr:ribosome-associated translation inhibitor RaiA [Microbacteriaceae bacterium]
MEIALTARGLDITDRFREYAAEKAEKVAALAAKAIALQIKVTRHAVGRGGSAGDDRVELTLVGPGPLVRAEAGAADKYAAFDLAYGRLLERVREGKDRRKVHRGRRRPTSLHEASSDGFAAVGVTPASVEVLRAVQTGSIPVQQDAAAEEAWSPVVIRRKLFAPERMTAEDALDTMELVGHDFFLFIDAETDRPSVVYRRQGWAYGVIALDAEAHAVDTVSSQRARRASR